MPKVDSYRDLRVWQAAIDLVPAVYALLKRFPKEETFALAGQVRRAVVSVAANIAEGHARQHTREFLQHLSIARGSLAEVDTLLVIAEKLGYISAPELESVSEHLQKVRMLLYGLARGLRAGPGTRNPEPGPGPGTRNPEPGGDTL